MKIILSNREATSLQRIMENAEHGSVEELNALLKDNKLVQYKICPIKHEIEIIINEDYMGDFLNVYEKFVGLFVSQTKAMVQTVQMFSEETEKVLAKYTKEVSHDNSAES